MPGTMQINILFFGLLRDVFGKSECIDMPSTSTVADVVDRYRHQASHLQHFWNTIAVSVNEHYAATTQTLSEGDEVALLPPVSGGSASPGNIHAD